MKIRTRGLQVAEDLYAVEAAIDNALAAAARLTGAMTEARLDTNVSAIVGQDAFDGVAETMTALTMARRNIVNTHHGLATVKDQVGLRMVSLGGVFKPPMQPPVGLAAENAA